MNKIVRPVLLLGFVLISLAAIATNGWAVLPGDHHGMAKGKVIKTLNANAWTMYTSNYGPFVYPQSNQAGGYWGGVPYNYIFGAGMWVGALDAADSPHVAVGYNPNSGASELGPANPYTWDYANYATDSLSRVYLSTNVADLAAWPLRDASNEPVVLSDQDGYATYSDENPAFIPTGETPVGVRIRQRSFAWNSGSNSDIVYFKFTVINGSAGTLHQVYGGPCFDADIGNESQTYANDRTDFDYTRNLAIQFQNEAEPGWPSVGYFGCRFLASAVNNTGAVVHVTDNQFPHDIQPGEPLGMTAMKIFTIDVDPVTDADRYKVMQGYNYTTMVMDAYDEAGSSTAGDKRFVMCTGPFELAPGDSVIISLGVMAAANREALLALCDTAQGFYNSMGVAGDKPRPEAAPVRPLLLANSPNPFRGATEINYQVAAEGPVRLVLYNGLGQLVRTLVDGRLGPGRYAARWDARNDAGQRLSAGVYLARLQAGNQAMTQKMILVK